MTILKRFFCLIFILLLIQCKEPVDQIPVLQIYVENPIGWENKEPAIVDYLFKEDSIRFYGTLKCRGGMSSRYWKHSYSLKTEEKLPLANLPKDNDWIINASYIDKTFMRHKISYDLFRQMHPENRSPLCTYTDVYINGEYMGLYVFMERLDQNRLKINKKDTMAVVFKEPPVFAIEQVAPKDPENIFNQKFPKIQNRNSSYQIENFRNFLITASDDEFENQVEDWISLRNVIDWHLLLLFSNNGDAVTKNFYLYRRDNNSPFQIALWDTDHSFGRDSDGEKNMMEREIDFQESILFKRILNMKFYQKMLQKRWLELRREGIFSEENLFSLIDENDRIISKHADRNFQKWPVNEHWYFDDNNYSQELDLMRTFIKARLKQLDIKFNQPDLIN
jgi:hypothetical protein